MERTQEAIGGFRLPKGVDARLKKRRTPFLHAWWRSKVSVCGGWAAAGPAKFVSGGS